MKIKSLHYSFSEADLFGKPVRKDHEHISSVLNLEELGRMEDFFFNRVLMKANRFY